MTGKPLTHPSLRRPAIAHRPPKPVEVTALLAGRSLSLGELERVSNVLAAEGLGELRPTRVVFAPADARAVSEGATDPIAATIIPDRHRRPGSGQESGSTLPEALEAARARGAILKENLSIAPEMLRTAEMAERLGMSEEGVRLKRKRHQILGLEFAKRGLRYPEWQILPDRQLLPGLPRLFTILGDDPWRVFRFLLQHHNELGGGCALDALRHGRIEAVLAAAENVSIGAFA